MYMLVCLNCVLVGGTMSTIDENTCVLSTTTIVCFDYAKANYC